MATFSKVTFLTKSFHQRHSQAKEKPLVTETEYGEITQWNDVAMETLNQTTEKRPHLSWIILRSSPAVAGEGLLIADSAKPQMGAESRSDFLSDC
jgi:hypothetical protein